MARKKKYEEVKGYWVYSIQIPSVNKYYIGVSKLQCSQRWRKGHYKGSSLEPYLDEWNSMTKTVLVDNLTKEQAYQYEGKIIDALSMNNLCINQQRSGLIKSDENAYHKELLKNNPEYHENQKQRCKQWRENNPEYHKQLCKQWRENNPDYMKQWREDNKEKIKEYQRQRYQKKKIEKQNQQLNLFS